MNKILKSVIAIFIFIVIMGYLGNVFELKTSHIKNSLFYENATDYDVLLLGSSVVQYGVSPLQLERDYGITAYNLSNSANSMSVNYWTLINSLDHNKDIKLVVLDYENLTYHRKLDKTEFAHYYIDSVPLSLNKLKMIGDLLDDEYSEDDSASELEFIWNFYLYHSRYKELNRNDFDPVRWPNRGSTEAFEVLRDINGLREFEKTLPSFDYVISDSDTQVRYLEMIIEKCKENDIDILLTYIPGNNFENRVVIQNEKAMEIAEKHDINYLDIINMDVYNEKIDYTPDGVHINYFGNRKITDFLGGYMRANYDLPYRKSDSFEDEYDYLIKYEMMLLNYSTQLEQQFTVAFDKKYDIVIEYNNLDVFNEEFYRYYFDYIGLNYDLITNNNLIVIEDGGENVGYCTLTDTISCEEEMDLTDKYDKIIENFSNNNSDVAVMVSLNGDNGRLKYTEFNRGYDEYNNVIYIKSD